MSRIDCKCKGDICHSAIWIEDDSYLWVQFADTHENNEVREVQIINGMDIETAIELRNLLNEVIARKAGL